MEYLPCGREHRLNLDCASLFGEYVSSEIDFYYHVYTPTLLRALLDIYIYI